MVQRHLLLLLLHHRKLLLDSRPWLRWPLFSKDGETRGWDDFIDGQVVWQAVACPPGDQTPTDGAYRRFSGPDYTDALCPRRGRSGGDTADDSTTGDLGAALTDGHISRWNRSEGWSKTLLLRLRNSLLLLPVLLLVLSVLLGLVLVLVLVLVLILLPFTQPLFLLQQLSLTFLSLLLLLSLPFFLLLADQAKFFAHVKLLPILDKSDEFSLVALTLEYIKIFVLENDISEFCEVRVIQQYVPLVRLTDVALRQEVSQFQLPHVISRYHVAYVTATSVAVDT